jgi:NTE family protein
MISQQRIGLALSGGGVRAMAFHCGVLRWLAEEKRLEYITHVSTVSGGSLLTGLVFNLAGWRWPTSEEYLGTVMPAVQQLLTTSSTQASALLRLLLPWNWRYFLSRANLVSQVIEHQWGVHARLADLPQTPVWSVNGTTAETGRRFRFKRDTCGDYELGYTVAGNFKVADAMAVSAAFPGLIGPLALRADHYEWQRRRSWGASPEEAERVTLPYKRLHLYDGGVYDNLGIEPLFDVGKRVLKGDIDYLIVSDAGAPLRRASPHYAMRLKRVVDITMDQVRALRIRTLMPALISKPGMGAYVMMGMEAQKGIQMLLKELPSHDAQTAAELLRQQWLSASVVDLAAQHPTNLDRLRPEHFERLATHGYQTLKWNEMLLQERGAALGPTPTDGALT